VLAGAGIGVGLVLGALVPAIAAPLLDPSIEGAASTAYTVPCGTRRASSKVILPLPQPASSTTSSPLSSRRSSCSAAHFCCGAEIRS